MKFAATPLLRRDDARAVCTMPHRPPAGPPPRALYPMPSERLRAPGAWKSAS